MKTKFLTILFVVLFNFSIAKADVISFSDLSPQSIDEKYGYSDGSSHDHGMMRYYDPIKALNPKLPSWNIALLVINLLITLVLILVILIILRKIMNVNKSKKNKIVFRIIAGFALMLYIIFTILICLKAKRINEQPAKVYFTLYSGCTDGIIEFDKYDYTKNEIQQFIKKLYNEQMFLVHGSLYKNDNIEYINVLIDVDGNSQEVAPTKVVDKLEELSRKLNSGNLYGIHVEEEGSIITKIMISKNDDIRDHIYYDFEETNSNLIFDKYKNSEDDIEKFVNNLIHNKDKYTKHSSGEGFEYVTIVFEDKEIDCSPYMVGSKLKDLFSDSKLSDDYLNSAIYRDKSNDYIYRIKIYRSKLSNHINRIETKKCSKYYINFDNLNYSFEFDKCQYSLDELKQFVEYLNIKKEHLYSDNDGNYVPSVTFGGIIKNEEIDQYYAKDNKSKLYSGSKTGLSGASVFEYIDNVYLGREYNRAQPLVLDLNAKYGIALFKEDNMVTWNIYFTRYKK